MARFLGFPAPDSSVTKTLAVATYTMYIDSYWTDNISVLQLPIRPVVTITSVHADPDRVYGADTEVNAAEYEIDKLTGLTNHQDKYKHCRILQTRTGAIKLSALLAFTLFHKDLVHAVCVYASQLHRAKSSQGKKSNALRGATTSYLPNTIPQEVKEILYPYRNSFVII